MTKHEMDSSDTDMDKCGGGTQAGCHGSSYLVCQCESGRGERPETLHLKLHLTDRRVKADAAAQTKGLF